MRWAKIPSSENFNRLKLCSAKIMFGETSRGEISVGENSFGEKS